VHAGIVPWNNDTGETTHAGLVTRRFESRVASASLALVLLALVLAPRATRAQSASQLGAWDGLILSPVGALAPMVRDLGAIGSRSDELSLRYGRWRYDEDDVVHDNIGLTWSRNLGFARAQLSLTGAYVLVECPTCSAWAMGGVDLESTMWTRHFASANVRPVATSVGLRVSLGGSRYLGTETTTSASAAVILPVDIALPFGKTSSLSASILPGFGFGRVTSTEVAESGTLPMIGAAIAWTVTSRTRLDIGVQRIIIAGGPTQLGAAFSLKLGSGGGIRP
jgi:hypothetical protein